MNTDFHSCGVDLASVLVSAIREQRLYSLDIADISDHLILRDSSDRAITKIEEWSKRRDGRRE